MTTLIIRLYEDDTKLMLHYDAAGMLQESSTCATWQDVSEHACDKKLIILLPGTMVRMLPVTLPNMSMNELQHAVPNSLEEQLAEDIHNLHFSIGNPSSTNQRHVAIIQKKIWHALLDELKTYNIYPDLILPDYLALPFEQDCWTVYIDSKYMLARLSIAHGFASDATLLTTLMELHIAQAPLAPHSIHLIQDPDIEKPHIDTSIPTTQSILSFAHILQPNALLENPPFNMLTRALRKKRHPTKRSYWYWCAISFAGFIAILLLGQLSLSIDFSVKQKKITQQLLNTYQRIFPGETVLIEPRLRVAQELKAYELNPNPFMLILQKIANAIQKNSTISITTLNYTAAKITLTITADTELSLTQFNKQLTNMGLTLTSNQTTLEDKKFSETLTLGLN